MVEDINKLTSKLLAFNDYTIASIKDLSHNSAKRYNVRVVLNKEYSQLDLIQLSKNLVIEVKNEVYYRSILTEERWSDAKAHVVWLLIYSSAEDEKNDNHIAHIQWIDDSLSIESAPLGMNGEDIGDGIILQWNDSYQTMAQLYEKHSIKKTEYIGIIDRVTKTIVSSVTEIKELVSKLKSKTISQQEYLNRMKEIQEIINTQYSEGTSIGVAPFECKDLDLQFQSVIALADNFLIHFSDIGDTERQLDFNYFNMCLRHYTKGIEENNFERRKI